MEQKRRSSRDESVVTITLFPPSGKPMVYRGAELRGIDYYGGFAEIKFVNSQKAHIQSTLPFVIKDERTSGS